MKLKEKKTRSKNIIKLLLKKLKIKASVKSIEQFRSYMAFQQSGKQDSFRAISLANMYKRSWSVLQNQPGFNLSFHKSHAG